MCSPTLKVASVASKLHLYLSIHKLLIPPRFLLAKMNNGKRFMTVNYLKRSDTKKHMISDVIPLFGPWNLNGLSLRSFRSKTMQISLQTMIDYLTLTISLRMV